MTDFRYIQCPYWLDCRPKSTSFWVALPARMPIIAHECGAGGGTFGAKQFCE